VLTDNAEGKWTSISKNTGRRETGSKKKTDVQSQSEPDRLPFLRIVDESLKGEEPAKNRAQKQKKMGPTKKNRVGRNAFLKK